MNARASQQNTHPSYLNKNHLPLILPSPLILLSSSSPILPPYSLESYTLIEKTGSTGMVNRPCSSIRKAWKHRRTTDKFMCLACSLACPLTCSMSSVEKRRAKGAEKGGEGRKTGQTGGEKEGVDRREDRGEREWGSEGGRIEEEEEKIIISRRWGNTNTIFIVYVLLVAFRPNLPSTYSHYMVW